jgi:hypothetical protein
MSFFQRKLEISSFLWINMYTVNSRILDPVLDIVNIIYLFANCTGSNARWSGSNSQKIKILCWWTWGSSNRGFTVFEMWASFELFLKNLDDASQNFLLYSNDIYKQFGNEISVRLFKRFRKQLTLRLAQVRDL